MNITIVGRKCTPREQFRQRADKKLSKIDKFFGSDADAKVVVTVEKNFHTVEVTLRQKGIIYRAQESAPNMNDALDKCVDTLIRQIRKNKTKLEKRMKTSFEALAKDEEPVADETEYDIVRTKTVAVKPQTVDEAILQMNLLGHGFYMFINAATDNFAVVYKRANGGYGLLEPASV